MICLGSKRGYTYNVEGKLLQALLTARAISRLRVVPVSGLSLPLLPSGDKRGLVAEPCCVSTISPSSRQPIDTKSRLSPSADPSSHWRGFSQLISRSITVHWHELTEEAAHIAETSSRRAEKGFRHIISTHGHRREA